MKKLIAGCLILLVALNVVLLWPKGEAKTGEESGTALKMPKIGLGEIKPGILPGLIKF